MGTCPTCQGETIHRLIVYTQWFEGKLVAVEHVPADVCGRCGEEYFDPDTVNRIQQVIYTGKPVGRLEVPLFDLAGVPR